MGTLQSFRKAYGSLKDSTKVGVAKLNSKFTDIDIAIVKATNHVERPPKERHIRRVFAATSSSSPHGDITYCIHALARRLAKTCNWVVEPSEIPDTGNWGFVNREEAPPMSLSPFSPLGLMNVEEGDEGTSMAMIHHPEFSKPM